MVFLTREVHSVFISTITDDSGSKPRGSRSQLQQQEAGTFASSCFPDPGKRDTHERGRLVRTTYVHVLLHAYGQFCRVPASQSLGTRAIVEFIHLKNGGGGRGVV